MSSSNLKCLSDELKHNISAYLDFLSLRKTTSLPRDDHDPHLNTPSYFESLSIHQTIDFVIGIDVKDKNNTEVSIEWTFSKSGSDTIFRTDTDGDTETIHENCDYEQLAKQTFCDLLRRNTIKRLTFKMNPNPDDLIWSIESIKCANLILSIDNVQDSIRLLEKVELPLSSLAISSLKPGIPSSPIPLPLEISDLEQFNKAESVRLTSYELRNEHLKNFAGRTIFLFWVDFDEDCINQLLKRWQNNEQPNLMHCQLCTKTRQFRWDAIVDGLTTRETSVFDDEDTCEMLRERYSFNLSDDTIEMSADGDDGKRAVVILQSPCRLEFGLVTRNGEYTDFDFEWMI